MRKKSTIRTMIPPTMPPMIGPHFLATDAAGLSSGAESALAVVLLDDGSADVREVTVGVGVTGGKDRESVVAAAVGAAVTVATA